MKKLALVLSVLFAVILAVPAFPAYAAAKSGECGAEGADVRWALDKDGTLTVSGSGDMTSYLFDADRPYDAAKIKSVVVESGVTAVGDRAFSGGKNISSVTLADSVEKIGQFAFQGAEKLKALEFPDALTSVGYSAFEGCAGLVKAELSEGLREVEHYAFKDCAALAEVSFPDSVETIGAGIVDGTALYNDAGARENGVLYIGNHLIAVDPDAGISSLNVREGTRTVADFAAAGIETLTEAHFPESVRYYGSGSFSGCGLKSLEIPLGAVIIGAETFENCKDLARIVFPDGIERIGYGAFYNTAYAADPENDENGLIYCGKYLIGSVWNELSESCRIREGTELIADGVFMGAEMIRTMDLPASMRGIGNSLYGFYADIGCLALEKITVDGANSVFRSEDGVLFNKDKTELILYPAGRQDAEYTVPSGVTAIGDRAFISAAHLERVTIPVGVKTIGYEAFRYDESLTELSVPEGVRGIGDRAMRDCSSLKKLSLPGSLEQIGDDLCGGSRKIEEIDFGGTEEQWDALTKYKDTVTYTEKEVVYRFKRTFRADGENGRMFLLPGIPVGAISDVRFPIEFFTSDGGAVALGALIGTGMTCTDADGKKLTVIVPGDTDGDGKVSAGDARSALRASAKIAPLDGAFAEAADISGDGRVQAGDARSILRVAARLDEVRF